MTWVLVTLATGHEKTERTWTGQYAWDDMQESDVATGIASTSQHAEESGQKNTKKHKGVHCIAVSLYRCMFT